MNKETVRKLREEKPLTAVEMLELDSSLENQAEVGISHLMKKEGHPEPSLAWRSSLNQRLAQVAPKPKKSPWRLWTALLAPVAAGVAFFVIFTSQPKIEPAVSQKLSVGDVEATLVMIHKSNDSAEETGVSLPDESDKNYSWGDLETF